MKDKPKLFYSYVRSKQKVKPVMPYLRKEEGETTTNDQEIADGPGKFFESVFTMEEDGDNILPEFENRVPENKVLKEVTFTELVIFIKLQQLKEDKVCGPDGIHLNILNDCAETLAKPLFLIFKESLSSCVVPLDWKLANIYPIYKKGSRSIAGNYRPVSLTCLASKLMESCVKDAILKHLLENNLNTPDQHGFTKGRSCLTNLLETIESCTEDVDQEDSVDVILLDFQKAFDKVPKKRLLQKLWNTR